MLRGLKDKYEVHHGVRITDSAIVAGTKISPILSINQITLIHILYNANNSIILLFPLSACVYSSRYVTDRFLPDKAIDLIDEAASRLRLQQESKPEAIENLDRTIIKIKIEIQALKKETDTASKERLIKLEQELKVKQAESEILTKEWQKEKERLDSLKRAKERLEQARNDLARAQREGNLDRASEVIYSFAFPN